MSKWLRVAAFNSSMSKIYHEKIDEVAAYSAFIEHWHQIVQIFKITDGNKKVTGDEVTAVTNHFGKMIDLLLVDLQQLMDFRVKHNQNEYIKKTVNEKKEYSNLNGNGENSSPYKLYDAAPPTPMYDYFMGERILESILHWSFSTGEYVHTMQLELLKVYELILTHSHSELLVFKPITEPLLALLHSCDTCIPLDVEKRLVVLLNLLWVNILHSTKLLDYFFLPKEPELSKRFLIFTLLLPFTHREGSLGQQARDTLLLSMTLCANNDVIAEYIAFSSNFCPILAAGLSGLYSTLPQTLNCRDGICYCLSPQDIANCIDLQMFVNFLEFCNAVAQTSHAIVRKQLIDFLYQGFLLPVVGPALSQNVSNELVAAIIYIEFFLKTVTEEGLRRAFLALLFLSQEFCEMPLIVMLISNLHSLNLQLSLVVLNLFETLIGMHCEDVMVSLVFQYLCPCTHIMLSQITKLVQPSFASSNHFLELLPNVCQQEDYLDNTFVEGTDIAHHSWSPESSTLEDKDIVGSTFLHYLKDAKYQVRNCTRACSSWVWKYNGQSPSPHNSAHLLCSNKVISFGNPSSDISNSHCISLPPCISSKDSLTKGKRTKSLPNFCSLDFSHHESFPQSKFSNEYNPMVCKYVAVNVNSCTVEQSNRVTPKFFFTGDEFSNNGMTFVYEDLGEASHDSIDESSGYESFTFRGSRDGSPLRISGIPKKNLKLVSTVNGLDDLSLRNTDLLSQSKGNDEFYQFLERCDSPPISSDSEKMDVIDEAYAFIQSEVFHLDYRDKKALLLNKNERFPSQRLSSSASSIDEIRNDFKGVETILHTQSKPTIGPFLEALLHLVENLLTSNTDVIILVMSCISKLASLPCSLLTSLLLNPSIVLQPSIRSLHQVLGQLKQRIDRILSPNDTQLLKEARTRLLNWSSCNSKAKCHESVNTPFIRGPKRRSFSQTFSALWKRNGVNDRSLVKEIPLQNLPDGAGYRYFKTPMSSNQPLNAFLSASLEKQQAAICAVLLKEWLLELTAIAYEHTVYVKDCHYAFINQVSNLRTL